MSQKTASAHGPVDGQRLRDVGVDALTIIEVALIEAAQQYLGRGDVGGDGHAVHIAQPQQILLVAAAGLLLEGVAEEEHKVYFVTGHPGRDLLDAAQLPGEVAVHGQTGGLRQHPTGGTGGNDRVAG